MNIKSGDLVLMGNEYKFLRRAVFISNDDSTDCFYVADSSPGIILEVESEGTGLPQAHVVFPDGVGWIRTRFLRKS